MIIVEWFHFLWFHFLNNFEIAVKYCKLMSLALLVCFTFVTTCNASVLYGVAGGSGSSASVFYSINTLDATSTFIQGLGNGTFAESSSAIGNVQGTATDSIAFNPNDGMMYHWTGRIMETINLSNQVVTNVSMGSWNSEIFGSTYNEAGSNFLTTDSQVNLASFTSEGAFDLIDPLPIAERGMAFVNEKLYVGQMSGNTLFDINPITAVSNGSVQVTMAGFNVLGINGLTTNPDDGILYALLRVAGGTRRLATLDPLTGEAIDIGFLSEGVSNIEFGARSPLPEPSAFLIWGIGLGLVSLGGGRRKRS